EEMREVAHEDHRWGGRTHSPESLRKPGEIDCHDRPGPPILPEPAGEFRNFDHRAMPGQEFRDRALACPWGSCQRHESGGAIPPESLGKWHAVDPDTEGI
ncbi:MAG: hypothetical protein L3J97_06195, partial [Thermoplasmata archaeon]|nr:hypothetical protein [Thermoplasmata archaeon]